MDILSFCHLLSHSTLRAKSAHLIYQARVNKHPPDFKKHGWKVPTPGRKVSPGLTSNNSAIFIQEHIVLAIIFSASNISLSLAKSANIQSVLETHFLSFLSLSYILWSLQLTRNWYRLINSFKFDSWTFVFWQNSQNITIWKINFRETFSFELVWKYIFNPVNFKR